MAALSLITSCTRYTRTEQLMTWSEDAQFQGMALPRGEKAIVLRFVDDPGQGLMQMMKESNSPLRDRLTQLGNPVRVSFECSVGFGRMVGFHIVAIGGQPYNDALTNGVAFRSGTSRPHPLESSCSGWF
jgi:hypothetical protein